MSWVRIPPSPHSKILKIYSIERAQEALGEIRSIVMDIKNRGREYSKCLLDASRLILNFRDNPYDKEGVLDRTIKTRQMLRQLFDELEKYGVILRDVEYGTVDFPADLDGDDIFLCCRTLEEKEISFWHSRDEPCTSRKPLKK